MGVAIQVLLFLTLMGSAVSDEGDNAADHHRQKRYLNWSGYMIKPDITINKYIPHPKSSKFNANNNYLSFALYYSNGTGVFHFVHENEAKKLRDCPRRAMHSGAYRYIYGKCPEDSSNNKQLITSGFCWKNSKLGFKSFTFNQKGKPYMNDKYFLNSNELVHKTEQTYLTNCYNDWRAKGYPLNGFSCTPRSTTPLAVSDGGVVVDEEMCCECGAGTMWQSIYLAAMAVGLHSLFIHY